MILVLAAAPALAQLGNPGGFAPGSTPQRQPGVVVPHEPNTQDRLFVQLMTSAGLGEVATGALAVESSRAQAVRDFGQKMRESHSDANAKLASLAQAAGIPVPSEPMDDQQAVLARLESTEPTWFDVTYLQTQLVGHQKAMQLLLWEIDNGQDPGLVKYAAATLPEVMQHLAIVQLLMSEHAGVAPQGLGAVMPAADAAPWRR
jgi:putative membrane protein